MMHLEAAGALLCSYYRLNSNYTAAMVGCVLAEVLGEKDGNFCAT